MERKLIKQGKQAYTISLPIHWIRKYGLEEKKYIQLEEKGNKLEIFTDISTPVLKTTLDITNHTRLETILKLVSVYMQGYDEITIKHDNLPLIREIVQSTLMGMIIEQYTEGTCTLKNIITTPADNIKQIIKKTIFILREQSKSLVKLSKKEIDLQTALTEEALLDYNSLYAMRFVNKYKTDKERQGYILICSTFDIVSDIMGEIAKHIEDNVQIAERVNHYIEKYTEYLMQNNFRELNKTLLDETKDEKKTFLDGLVYALKENLYNYLAYICETFNKKDINTKNA